MSVPTKWQIAQYWLEAQGRDVFAPHLEDAAHPCCFACGWFSERWAKETPRTSWERAALERAHIVPAGLGGSDAAANLLLLCEPCHRESPDWHDPREMATWISRRDERASKELEHVDMWLAAIAEVPLFKEALAAVDARGGTTDEVVGVMRDATRKAVVHGAGVGLSQATMAAILRDTVRQLDNHPAYTLAAGLAERLDPQEDR